MYKLLIWSMISLFQLERDVYLITSTNESLTFSMEGLGLLFSTLPLRLVKKKYFITKVGLHRNVDCQSPKACLNEVSQNFFQKFLTIAKCASQIPNH